MEMTTASEHVAANVRLNRTERGWSLEKLAHRLSDVGHPISVSGLSKLESGNRGVSVDDLQALSLALQVSTESLLGSPTLQDHDPLRVLVGMWVHRYNGVVQASDSLARSLKDAEAARIAFTAATQSLQTEVRGVRTLHQNVDDELRRLGVDSDDCEFLREALQDLSLAAQVERHVTWLTWTDGTRREVSRWAVESDDL